MRIMHTWLHTLQTVVFAPHCLLCHAPASLELDLCPHCEARLPRQQHACRHCAQTLPAASTRDCCVACLRQPRFDAAIAGFEYAPPVDWLITRLKFHHRLAHARVLGYLLGSRIQAAAVPRPDCIVPAPLHPRRRRERGYNQAELIAGHTARLLDLPVTPQLATRARHTRPQRTLPAAQRRRNVHGAFTATRACAGRHIAIVDDVVTTGHTAEALAAALHQAQAASVQLWCVARA